jgi:hypothetical protein
MVSEVRPKTVQQEGIQQGQRTGQQKGQQKQNLVKVLSICNYDLYQTAQELTSCLRVSGRVGKKFRSQSSKGPARG